jgi:hypothetical protein
MPESPVGKTKHTELTLDDIASMQPGLGRLMPEVSQRYHIAYYAAKGGNWRLAAYQLHELGGLLRLGAVTRPKYAAQLTAFDKVHLSALLEAVAQHDFSTFERAFERATEVANIYHQATDHPEVIWRLPHNPPDHLDLGPQPEPDPGPS